MEIQHIKLEAKEMDNDSHHILRSFILSYSSGTTVNYQELFTGTPALLLIEFLTTLNSQNSELGQ